MKAITNATLVMRDHLIEDAALFIEDGKIAGFGEMRGTPVPKDCETVDAGGLYVGPGFVDVHSHAGGGVKYADDLPFAAGAHLRHGSTTILPSILGWMSYDEMLAFVDMIRDFMKKPEGANVGGLYMEGPYLNPKFGSHRDPDRWQNRRIDRADYGEFLRRCGDAVKVWVLAPEREGVLSFVRDAKAANPAVRFAVGHSEASPEEIEALMPYGLCIGTHHTNATGDRPKYPECRGVCVDETVNYNREIYAELICDSRGIHVDPYMQRLIRRIKGEDRLILISDATSADGPVPPGYEGVTDLNFDRQREISGSNLTLDAACRNMMKHTGASIVDVFRYASTNPARAVGFADRGGIAVGKRADLVITDHKMNVQGVFLAGERKV